MLIRPAQPGDVHAVAPLMYSSGPELYDFLYKMPEGDVLDYIRYEFLSGRGLCGYRNVTVALVNEKVVATGCFYDGSMYKRLMLGSTLNIMRFFGPRRMWGVLLRANHVGSVMKPPNKDELYLANFGVDESMRGQGIGSGMLEQHIRSARESGYRTFALDVATNNPRAQALYHRLGLRVLQLKHFTGRRSGYQVPDSKKMELVFSSQ